MSVPHDEEIPQETLESMVDLVETGPVLLGGYTLAEIDAVGGISHLHEKQPDAMLVAEAVRSLAARSIISSEQDSEELKIRGDLGIATAFQHRSRTTLDVRITGTKPDTPWRIILMPQPEGITLEVLIDALGIHYYSLRGAKDAYKRLWDRLPHGDRGDKKANATDALGASGHTALISVNHWTESGDIDTVDVVLAQDEDVCHVFLRDQDDPSTLKAAALDDGEWRELVKKLAEPA
ncbi:hypothetical protein ACMYYO_07340 [Dermacoccaceae bacterium W4C1]